MDMEDRRRRRSRSRSPSPPPTGEGEGEYYGRRHNDDYNASEKMMRGGQQQQQRKRQRMADDHEDDRGDNYYPPNQQHRDGDRAERLERERRERMARLRADDDGDGDGVSTNTAALMPSTKYIAQVGAGSRGRGRGKVMNNTTHRNGDTATNMKFHDTSANGYDGVVNKNVMNDVANDESEQVEVDDEEQMRIMMGFGGFGTTKGKAVADNQHGAARGAASKNKGRKYRQYMNRKGGFNRPLDKMN